MNGLGKALAVGSRVVTVTRAGHDDQADRGGDPRDDEGGRGARHPGLRRRGADGPAHGRQADPRSRRSDAHDPRARRDGVDAEERRARRREADGLQERRGADDRLRARGDVARAGRGLRVREVRGHRRGPRGAGTLRRSDAAQGALGEGRVGVRAYRRDRRGALRGGFAERPRFDVPDGPPLVHRATPRRERVPGVARARDGEPRRTGTSPPRRPSTTTSSASRR